MDLQRMEGDTNLGQRRGKWQTDHLGKDARALITRDEDRFLKQSLSTPCLSAIKKADGIWIEDYDGRRYMDFHGNNVHHIGYGHPRLKEALKKQMDALPFCPRRFTNDVTVELAEKLTEAAPDGLSRLLLTTGGSDAVEVALKVARAKTGRFKTLSFWDAFHGAGFGASSIGGEAIFRSGKIGPLLSGTEHVAPFACYRCPYGHADNQTCGLVCANMIRYVLEKEQDVAAVIAEPVRSVPYLPPKGFWEEVKKACTDFGTLLIFDEIPNGLGKTGAMFTADHFDMVPDILVTGKALGGGMLPIAATLCRDDLDVADEYAFGHYTHEKNPMTARAALTTLEIIEEDGLVENGRSVGAYALECLYDLKDRFDIIGDIRGLGFLMGIELVKDRDSKAPHPDAAEQILYSALSKGLSFKTTMGSVLTLTPSLITTRAQMDDALDILEECLTEVSPQ